MDEWKARNLHNGHHSMQDTTQSQHVRTSHTPEHKDRLLRTQVPISVKYETLITHPSIIKSSSNHHAEPSIRLSVSVHSIHHTTNIRKAPIAIAEIHCMHAYPNAQSTYARPIPSQTESSRELNIPINPSNRSPPYAIDLLSTWAFLQTQRLATYSHPSISSPLLSPLNSLPFRSYKHKYPYPRPLDTQHRSYTPSHPG